VADCLHLRDVLSLLRAAPELVRILIDRQVAVQDEVENTILHILAEEAGDSLVWLPLAKESPQADCKNIYGQTPLSCAAALGNEALVRLLVERYDVEADSKDNDGGQHYCTQR
jgi:ankyrin repeat protein